ncbi:hypothetical protein R3P38DRAFT_3175262 [Favolaschia claudopus]|uniref:Uncharacterized protein n=1 Tax=Favolaschia claudopus TaxID=2862362 RepID=A0AAW0DDU7_9AGAR
MLITSLVLAHLTFHSITSPSLVHLPLPPRLNRSPNALLFILSFTFTSHPDLPSIYSFHVSLPRCRRHIHSPLNPAPLVICIHAPARPCDDFSTLRSAEHGHLLPSLLTASTATLLLLIPLLCLASLADQPNALELTLTLTAAYPAASHHPPTALLDDLRGLLSSHHKPSFAGPTRDDSPKILVLRRVAYSPPPHSSGNSRSSPSHPPTFRLFNCFTISIWAPHSRRSPSSGPPLLMLLWPVLVPIRHKKNGTLV